MHYAFVHFMKSPPDALKVLDDTEFYFRNVEVQDKANPTMNVIEKQAKSVYRSLGERKVARKDLQPFLYFLKLYVDIPLDGFKQKIVKKTTRKILKKNHQGQSEETNEVEEEEEEEEEKDSVSIFQSIKNIFIKSSGKEAKINPTDNMNPVLLKFSNNLMKSNNINNVKIQPEDAESIADTIITKEFDASHLYSKLLKENLDDLITRADNSRMEAMTVLEQVDVDMKRLNENTSTKSNWMK